MSGTFSADSVEEEVFENERFARGAAGSQWSDANLLAGEDPRRFQYALPQSDPFPRVRSVSARGIDGLRNRKQRRRVGCAHARSS